MYSVPKERRITRKKAANKNSKKESKSSSKIKDHPLNLADDLLSYGFIHTLSSNQKNFNL